MIRGKSDDLLKLNQIQFHNQNSKVDIVFQEGISFNAILLLIFNKFCLMQSNRAKKIGKYMISLNQTLGEGAFGKVFRARQCLPSKESNEINQQRQDVAVKVLSKQELQKNLRTKNAFRNELSIMKKIKNKNVIQFYDHIESRTSHYIFLELAEGGTLRTRLRMEEQGRFDESTTRRILGQIVNGFGQLAIHGILHRDLKPENILIKDNIIKIADFGFAKISQNNSFFTSEVGTPFYMAPQILSGKRYTYKCDIWSLGVITYQMMFGKKPWTIQQNSWQGLRKQITTRKIIFPENIEVSAKMKQFILGCLQIDQDTRYDWDQIFSHPIFKGKLLPYFDGKKQGQTIINFIMSEFRCNLYSNNINLKQILAKLQHKLIQADFRTFIISIDKSITPQSITLLFNYIVNVDKYIEVQNLKNLFGKYGCFMNKIDPSQIQIEEGPDSKEGIILMTRLKKIIDKKKINIKQLLMENNQQKENIMNLQDFTEYIHKIDPSFNINQIDCLFKIFDLNSDGKISQSQLQTGIYKIAQIMPMEEEE